MYSGPASIAAAGGVRPRKVLARPETIHMIHDSR